MAARGKKIVFAANRSTTKQRKTAKCLTLFRAGDLAVCKMRNAVFTEFHRLGADFITGRAALLPVEPFY